MTKGLKTSLKIFIKRICRLSDSFSKCINAIICGYSSLNYFDRWLAELGALSELK